MMALSTCCRNPGSRLLKILSHNLSINTYQYQALFHSSKIIFAGGDWRKSKGKSVNINTSGYLTDLPDYTFLDGRQTPYGVGKLKRALEQQDIAQRIKKLSKEVDEAVEYEVKVRTESGEEKNALLQRKLKEKGKSHHFSLDSPSPRTSH